MQVQYSMVSLLKFYLLLPLSILTTLCYSSPVPQDFRVISRRTNTTESICGLSVGDSAATWSKSGADKFLESFIRNRAEGSEGWANAIGQQKLANGQVIDSTLDCDDLIGNCDPIPSELCLVLKEPALFHIRYAMSKAHGLLVGYENQIQSGVISETLQLSKLVEDFGEPEQPKDVLFEILSGAFNIAAGITAPFSPVSGAFAILAGIFSISAASRPEDEPVDIQRGIL